MGQHFIQVLIFCFFWIKPKEKIKLKIHISRNKVFSLILLSILFSCNIENIEPPAQVNPIPTPQQLEWQEMEFDVRLYTATELRGLLEASGLRWVTVYGGWNGEPFGPEARRIIALARKT